MAQPHILLDEDAVLSFIVTGVMIVRPSLPRRFHEEIVTELDRANEGQPNPRSGVVEAVPRLREIYDDPAVSGALQSLLGADLRMHYYTVSHCNPPGYPAQLWHQDSALHRLGQIWRLTVLYYPRDITYEMGPTLVVPGTQYRKVSNTDLHRYGAFSNQIAIVAEAGTVFIMHYDLWHRGAANRSDRMRYMVKTVFERTSNPTKPSWQAGSESSGPQALTKLRQMQIPIDNETETYKHQERWIAVWKWLHGEEHRPDDWFPEHLP